MTLRDLPAVGKLLTTAPARDAIGIFGAEAVTQALRQVVDAERVRRLSGTPAAAPESLLDAALVAVAEAARPRLRRVVNATGVVLNTNMGRAPLAQAALTALAEVAGGYCNLELNLDTGSRGSRHDLVEGLLRALTGAEAAIVTNNGAASMVLIADTFARGREVVVSRGQLIEIGGGFRLPDVLEASGARLREVGTTNRTYLTDFARAVGPETGLLLLSHTSNYLVVGYTAEVPRADVAALGAERGVWTAEDLGSGLLVDLAAYGLPPEPSVQASVAAGLDVVAVSGDKLMGGPQAGIIVGKRAAIAALRANPFMRAFRPDKLALAALEATLRLYTSPAGLSEIPVLAMLARTAADLHTSATTFASRLQGLTVEVATGESPIGGGTLPGVTLPTYVVKLRPPDGDVVTLAARLRRGEPAVVGRIAEDWLVLDLRTWCVGDDARVAAALAAVNPAWLAT